MARYGGRAVRIYYNNTCLWSQSVAARTFLIFEANCTFSVEFVIIICIAVLRQYTHPPTDFRHEAIALNSPSYRRHWSQCVLLFSINRCTPIRRRGVFKITRDYCIVRGRAGENDQVRLQEEHAWRLSDHSLLLHAGIFICLRSNIAQHTRTRGMLSVYNPPSLTPPIAYYKHNNYTNIFFFQSYNFRMYKIFQPGAT